VSVLAGVALVAATAWLVVRARREAAVRADAEAARRLVAAHRFLEAQEPLRRWLEARPHSGEALFLVARGAIGLGMFDQGLAALDRAAALEYSASRIDRERGLALSHLKRHEEAEPILRRLADRPSANDPEVDQALARVYLETFQLRAAGEAIERWIRHAPGEARAYLWRAQLGRRTNASPEDLAHDYEQALLLAPADREAHLGLADVLLQGSRFEEALPHFEAARGGRTDDPEADLGLGSCLAGLGREEEARRCLDRAIAQAPADSRPLIERAKLALRRGTLDGALADLDRAVLIDPFEPEGHYHRGLVLARLGRAEEARGESERASRLRAEHEELTALLVALYGRPGDVEQEFRAARWFFLHGRPEEGRRWAEKILRADPSHPATHRLLADHYEGEGDAGRANYHRLRAGPAAPAP
jgi:tetratricopeptide (TPR) repeat protein